jgi:hypothetical protein
MANQSKASLADFVNSSRNYLILIVSLIALVCLFVGIAATSQTLETLQRWILIGFVILFAVLGLTLSVWLILRQARLNAVSRENREFGWKPSPTESQRRKLDDNLREITVALKNPDVPTADLFSAYVVAEDLALRQIQQETKEPILRHQSVGAADFDAVLFKQDAIVCIEIAFLVAPDVSQVKINEVLRKIDSAKKTFERLGKDVNLKLLLVLIRRFDRAGEADLRSSLVKKFSATSVDIDVRLFDFETLQKIYAPA